MTARVPTAHDLVSTVQLLCLIFYLRKTATTLFLPPLNSPDSTLTPSSTTRHITSLAGQFMVNIHWVTSARTYSFATEIIFLKCFKSPGNDGYATIIPTRFNAITELTKYASPRLITQFLYSTLYQVIEILYYSLPCPPKLAESEP